MFAVVGANEKTGSAVVQRLLAGSLHDTLAAITGSGA
jgi:uncharacterized protein YbjT (DUF2867 family)